MKGFTSVNIVESLIELQEIDAQIRELEQEKLDIPHRQAVEKTRLNEVNAALQVARSQLEKMQNMIKEDEAEAEAHSEELRRFRQSEAQASSQKELDQILLRQQSLESDIAAANHRAQARTRDELPKHERKVKEAEARFEKEQIGMNGVIERLGERLKSVEARLEELGAARLEKVAEAKKVDPRALAYYERVRTRRWPAIVPLGANEVCEGCHMNQPQFVGQLVRHNALAAKEGKPQQLATCTMCGRMLYTSV